ncbi:MAG: hypothetical protein SFV15_02800 [Polyangiaceae bacterium]|nr:hypothetical protein [Polyangiaceae bacterium]
MQRHRWFPIVAIFIAFGPLSGCYHYRVAPVQTVPADDGHAVVRHSMFWGLMQSRAEQPNCQGNGSAEVVASSNLGFAFISVATLGIWMPMTLEWKCAKDRVRVETGLD